MKKNKQKNDRITEKWAKNRQFYKNARLNGYARFKTGDFGTLVQDSAIFGGWQVLDLVISEGGQFMNMFFLDSGT